MVAGYDIRADMWPGREKGAPLAPVRVGMDARTGKILIGWPHVVQSMTKLFATRYHERILRPWAGSFVPHLLGENTTESVITRFWWAVCTAIDLWEPCYTVNRIRVLKLDGTEYSAGERVLTSVEEIRQGHITFQMIGRYMPRGHLGDRTPEASRGITVFGRGNGRFEASDRYLEAV